MIKSEIGEIAGAIWKYLDRSGESLFCKMKKEVLAEHKNVDEVFFLLAVGWLLRENNIQITRDAGKFENSKVRLQ